MTSNPRTRYTNAARYITNQIGHTVTTLENPANATCPHAYTNNTLVALELKRLQRIILGDIGEEQTEIESEPTELPTTVPAPPVTVPA